MDHPHRLIKSLNTQRRRRKQAITKLAQELQIRGLTLRVLSRGRTVVVLGHSAKAGMISRLLRVPHLEVARSWKVFKLLMSQVLKDRKEADQPGPKTGNGGNQTCRKFEE